MKTSKIINFQWLTPMTRKGEFASLFTGNRMNKLY